MSQRSTTGPRPPFGSEYGLGYPETLPSSPPTRRRWRITAAAVLVVGVGLGGFALGHGFSGSNSQLQTSLAGPATQPAKGNTGTQLPGNTGNIGPGSQGGVGNSGNSGNSATPGTGNSGSGGIGQFPFGNSGAFGFSPFGNSGSVGGGASTGNGTSAAGSPSDVSAIAAKVAPALVDINTTFGYQGASGAGTGIVLTSSGEILTNNHVINGATSISVTDLGNGKKYSATVVGYDATHDIAVLQLVGASGLKTATLADSSAVTIGTPVVAIGNAGGTGGTPSAAGGSVTAVGQSISASDSLDGASEQLTNLIEVNADVQPGDSGGSLVNASGEVIGVDTAASQTFSLQTTSGRGYAIPISSAAAEAKSIEAGAGTADIHVGRTAFLGILVESGSVGAQSCPNAANSSGAVVHRVEPNSAAAGVGLAECDVITTFDGQAIPTASSISALLVTHHPGDKVVIGWTDTSGATHTGTATLQAGPSA